MRERERERERERRSSACRPSSGALRNVNHPSTWTATHKHMNAHIQLYNQELYLVPPHPQTDDIVGAHTGALTTLSVHFCWIFEWTRQYLHRGKLKVCTYLGSLSNALPTG